METRLTTSYLTGFGFAAFTARLWVRLALRRARKTGSISTARELGRALIAQGSLSAAMPRRFVLHRGHVWGVPDLPPLDTDAFLDCLEREVSRVSGAAKERPVTAIVSLTARCPHHCPYCYVDPTTREAEEPSVELLADTIGQLAAAGVFTFHLSGGEPALRADEIVELLGRFRLRELGFWLLTTGSGLDATHLERLMAAGLTGVMVSLDSHELSHVNRLKGSDEAYRTAVDTMKAARGAGLLVAVNAVMNRGLLGEAAFFRFIDAVAGYGASFVNCYAPRPQAEALPPELAPFSVDDYRTLDRLTRRCNASGRHRPLAFTPDLWEAQRGCQGGTSFLYIDPAGGVRRCPFLSRSYGNIREGKIEEIIDKMQTDPAPEVCAGNRLLSAAIRSRFRR